MATGGRDCERSGIRRLPVLLVAALALGASSSSPANVARVGSRAELTFTRVTGRGSSVWIARADGSAARQVVTRAFDGRLSFDGRWLAYSRRQRSPGSGLVPLYVAKLSGGAHREIGDAFAVEWSPVAARLAVVDRAGLFLVDPATGRRRRLARGANIWQVTFSPDGRAIAYARSNGRGGGSLRVDIFAVRLPDGVTTRLTRDGHSAHPLWGPNWIVYQRLRWAGGIAPLSRLWLMRPDGSGKRLFARGAEGRRGGFPVFGLDPLALSRDGRHLLACQAFEFGCPRVTFTVPDGRRFGFPHLTRLERKRGATPIDLSRDGARILVDVGSPHDVQHHGIYELPFAGGKPRLIARDAIEASWRR